MDSQEIWEIVGKCSYFTINLFCAAVVLKYFYLLIRDISTVTLYIVTGQVTVDHDTRLATAPQPVFHCNHSYGIPCQHQLNISAKVTLRPTISRSVPSWYRAPSGAHDQILISVWHLLFCRCRAPPLTRGRVCHLYSQHLSQSQNQSQSYVTTDDQSVSKSWFQAPCGSQDRIFISVDIYEYCFIDCGRPLWREVGSVICHSPSIVSKYIQTYM
jgi:hypothetical protein